MVVAAGGYFVLGVWFSQNYSLNFRHQESLSEAGGLAFFLFGFRSWFKAYLLYLILKHLNGVNITLFDRTILFSSMISLALAPVSSYDVIFLALSFLLSLGLENIVFPRYRSKNILKKIANLFKPILGVVLVVATVYSGTANKIGTEATNELFLEGDVTEFFLMKTVQRASTWMVSIMAITKEPDNFIDPDMAAETMSGIISNLGLRMCKLVGTECGEPPKYWSVNRRNFYYVYRPELWAPRTGSSPGIFASAFYIPFFPIGVILVVLYTLFVLRRLSGALHREGIHLDMIGVFLLLFFVSALFESPIDYINFLSPSFIYALFYFAACSAGREVAINEMNKSC
jgi:hypothetical protein